MMTNLIGNMLSGGGISWGRGEDPRAPEGISLRFPLRGRSLPTAREAKRRVAALLRNETSVSWFMIRGSEWIVDLAKVREAFELDSFDWLTGEVVAEPEYDMVPDTFRPQEMRCSLSLVFERGSLEIAREPSWDEYPEDELDELLPLLRRRAFDRDLARMVSKQGGVLVFFDVDHFKKVNDTFGHPVGDAVLIGVAQILRDIAGRRGRGYRCGGEEMLVLLPEFTPEEAIPIVERIRAAVESATWPQDEALRVTISAGIAAAGGANCRRPLQSCRRCCVPGEKQRAKPRRAGRRVRIQKIDIYR